MPAPHSPDETQNGTGYELYIMRHGIAEREPSDGSRDDSRRELTPEGKDKMRQIARGLKRVGFEIDWIVTSPLVRAAETAQIVAESLASKVPMDLSDGLRPGESSDKLLAYLAKQPERKRILLVGHEPDLSLLAARLMSAGRDANVGFKKGGCCLITFDEFPQKGAGQLVWWLTPKLLRSLKKVSE